MLFQNDNVMWLTLHSVTLVTVEHFLAAVMIVELSLPFGVLRFVFCLLVDVGQCLLGCGAVKSAQLHTYGLTCPCCRATIGTISAALDSDILCIPGIATCLAPLLLLDGSILVQAAGLSAAMTEALASPS